MSSARGFRLYGLTLESPFPLPCPREDLRRRPPDVRLSAGAEAQFVRARAGDRHRRDWFSSCTQRDGDTYLRWRGLFEFLISPTGRQILYHPLAHANQESFNVYLLGQVLSFSLLAFGVDPLHGSAVLVDGGAVAILGNCGHGKSTLAASLLTLGCPVVTDDLIALDERPQKWMVHPGIPRIKLFPSVARRIFGSTMIGTPMNQGTSKLVLPLHRRQVASAPVPLRALYVLSDPQAGRSRKRSKVRIEPLSGVEAFMTLVRATFNLIALDRSRLANQFAIATRLAASIPIRRLTYDRAFSALPEVCEALLADAAGV